MSRRTYSTKDSSVVWLFDTNKEFPIVNGVKATGDRMIGGSAVGRTRPTGLWAGFREADQEKML